MLVDTHAHIHSKQYDFGIPAVLVAAQAAGVSKIVCVGTGIEDSAEAVAFASQHPGCFATVGLHPHDAKRGAAALKKLSVMIDQPKVVAIGECGLDYYYQHSPRADQKKVFRRQIELALQHNRPLAFHVREAPNQSAKADAAGQAFDDFVGIVGDYQNIRGVVHSFTSSVANLKRILGLGLYVAFNGIMTFTKDEAQLAAAKAAPLDRIVLETDAPFLTPAPYRGKVNEPSYVRVVADFLARLRGESLEALTRATTANAHQLFNLDSHDTIIRAGRTDRLR